MKYIFISDFFENEVNGGAELTDAKLRTFLTGEIEKRKSIQVSLPFLEKNKNCRFIISNFINLGESEKKYLQLNCNYIIYEHDHKYLRTRDPSVFKDYQAPSDQIINRDFYVHAKAVVCQTDLHGKVVKQNLKIDNIVIFGGSIWSDEELDWLETNLELATKFRLEHPESKDAYAYQDIELPNKGTKAAAKYITKIGMPIKACPWKEFIQKLTLAGNYVFFPTVLETCSRVCVEARMLGIKVIANNNVSAFYEDWFKKYKGKELIDYFRNKNKSISEFIESCFKQQIKQQKIGDITVILNLYKRPQNLQKQIEAFRNQTIEPKEIWIWQNYDDANNVPVDYLVDNLDYPYVKFITSNHNWGIYGRFTMAQMVQTEFICINDDDTIPGSKWLETCLESYSTHPGLQGGIGVVLTSDDYKNHYRIGWAEPRSMTEEVDLVGHSWFFPKIYLKYMWMEEPFTWRMEDAHFSYCLQKYGNIKTYVPPQDTKEKSSSILGYELGIDEVAMSNPVNHNQFYSERSSALRHYFHLGWKPLYVTNKKMY